ncbi:leucine-rich repeat domain-containing protein, partial [Finegoldia magna]|uniref:leucine-rich repeat domain-containing protein n=1 Tax=Finegoldia magna TaxID=1260 RepID=UPI002907F960|nr:hypothetical protein [Finegoldia magna]MDU6776205.1 hypothetical protein [Finegoldia magna]
MKKQSKLIKVILAFVMIIGAFSFNSSFAAAQDVEINETNFPDAKFREYVKEFDKNRDEKLSEEEIKSVTSIFAEYGEKNLKGLEYFIEIKSLFLGYSVNYVDTSKNTKLEKIYFSGNDSLRKLDLSHNNKLNVLRLENTNIEKLNLSNNTNLEYGELWNNKLKEINLKNCKNLAKLNVDSNKLKSIDLKDCVNLDKFSCSDNELEKLDISNNKKLNYLNLRNNRLQSLDTTKNRELDRLVADMQSFNYYTDINHRFIDLGKLPGKPNPKRIKNIKNGKLVGNKIVLDKDKEFITYDYESRPGEIQRHNGDVVEVKINVKTGFTEEEDQPSEKPQPTEENRISGRNRIST